MVCHSLPLIYLIPSEPMSLIRTEKKSEPEQIFPSEVQAYIKMGIRVNHILL